MTIQDEGLSLTIALEVTIRIATKDDLPKLEWYGQFRHFRRLFRRSYRHQQLGNRLMLIADSNDFPIGRLFVQFQSSNTVIANGFSRAYLYSFHVMEMFRGRGIGTQLIETAERILRERKFTSVTIAVAKQNERALQLYRKRGYKTFADDAGEWRYYDHHGRIRYVQEPCWLMQKELSHS